MVKKLFVLGCLSGIVFFASFLQAQETKWVSSTNAKLKAGNSASSETIKELPLGEKLAVIQQETRWIQVRTSAGYEGWIYRGRLSNTPPSEEIEEESDSLFAGAFSSDISAEEVDSDRSIRGLSDETEEYARARGTDQAYKRALDKVLIFTVSEKQLDNFLRKGKIGEYAE